MCNSNCVFRNKSGSEVEDEEEPEGEDLNSEDVRIVYPIVYMLMLILKIETF